MLAGLRSGARGGPLAIEEAEVQYVLLAPVDRGAALRPAALRQMRIAALAGAVLGAVVGNFVFRRVPGLAASSGSPAWRCFGALLPVCIARQRPARLRPPAARRPLAGGDRNRALRLDAWPTSCSA